MIKQRTQMSVQEFLRKRPVFTYAEFQDFTMSDKPRGKKAPEWLLAKYTRSGRVLRVRRELFVTVPPGADPKDCPVDPFLLAAKMTDDAVLAYHTALEFHGRAHSVHWRFLYLSERAVRPFTFRTYQFKRVLFPKPLRRKGQVTFGVKVADSSGLDVRVTELERTLVDVLDRPDLAGGWAEVWQSLESVEFFDLDKVAEYVLLLENATTAAKVGFYLEQHREALMVEDRHLKPLLDRRPKSPHYLARDRNRPSRLVPEWNLVVPTYVLERSWEEPQ
jgi:predicted transcriptional regulator of viral defense system